MREDENMTVEIISFGHNKGQTYEKIELTNSSGISIVTTNLGAGLLAWKRPVIEKKSQIKNILLSFDQASDMLGDDHYGVGKSLIKWQPTKKKDSCLQKIEDNSTVNRKNLKSQQNTIIEKNTPWDYQIIDSPQTIGIKFTFGKPYEGIEYVQVSYLLDTDNRLTIQDQIKLTEAGRVQVLHPLYFNLNPNQSSSILNHQVSSTVQSYRLSQTAKWLPIQLDSAFNLASQPIIGQQFSKKEHDFEIRQGYDHDFLRQENSTPSNLLAKIRANGQSLSILSDKEGFSLNTFNFVWRPRRWFSKSIKRHSGLAITPQNFKYDKMMTDEKALLLYENTTVYQIEEEQ